MKGRKRLLFACLLALLLFAETARADFALLSSTVMETEKPVLSGGGLTLLPGGRLLAVYEAPGRDGQGEERLALLHEDGTCMWDRKLFDIDPAGERFEEVQVLETEDGFAVICTEHMGIEGSAAFEWAAYALDGRQTASGRQTLSDPDKVYLSRYGDFFIEDHPYFDRGGDVRRIVCRQGEKETVIEYPYGDSMLFQQAGNGLLALHVSSGVCGPQTPAMTSRFIHPGGVLEQEIQTDSPMEALCAQPEAVYGLTRAGRLWRFDGQAWTETDSAFSLPEGAQPILFSPEVCVVLDGRTLARILPDGTRMEITRTAGEMGRAAVRGQEIFLLIKEGGQLHLNRYGTAKTGLHVFAAQLPKGKKYPVYMGPSEEAPRRKKAMVSTNGWVHVYGRENGFLLIEYEINAQKRRFGYIRQEADVPPLALEHQPVFLKKDAVLTDDPFFSGAAFALLPEGEQVDFLAEMNGFYYVETADGARGFASQDAFER